MELRALRPYAWALALGVFVPLSWVFELIVGPGVGVFAAAGVGIIPLAWFMGLATEELGKHAGPGIGGLLNATFGNATELIIALFALAGGLHEVVKASITGSIIGNILLVLGLSFAGVGIFLASAVDPLIGLGVLVVGAFLLILPFAALGPEE